ncbi:solute carrier family 25 (mitochondrial carnitine/acylcarnitine transporter), member 20/29 [Fistulifera solaris]|uniref:Solute carrier family 25 (Mitochondrial carnitine/acylcarnitine transporter), member 20/29 n=1 Tax=Fistulifera solaris TaxID=1519565 RepID=A0A1Z5JW86_FISSO|nr:solute carrier family 25 (mitochondrial carnitine/acylcarnitine transporter), member 20/29 [Fistulifera solaris]|eukprot:GAX18295.1 solute carrier family 25 (mitochondrial carnitine/acylcarnitine transporter), member 20/29 [Fistulifera solaris]
MTRKDLPSSCPETLSTSPAKFDLPIYWDGLAKSAYGSTYAFLPDFTEHPKPKRRPTVQVSKPELSNSNQEDDVTFFHDFVAGGVAGCASVIVGHPFDSMKVRQQTNATGTASLRSLFRGMSAPLSAATAINAVVFGSYGGASRFYDEYIQAPQETDLNHDPWQKSWVCGSFAGMVQCVIIAPMEHVKLRVQTSAELKGSRQAVSLIVKNYGVPKLFQGWWSTFLREVPAFGLYFASYDYMKDACLTYLSGGDSSAEAAAQMNSSHAWLASAMAGGSAGCLTWGFVYPIDVIKTHIQIAPLDKPAPRILTTAQKIIQTAGYRALFRGLGITLIRAFPVNGTIFPVYEFTLKKVVAWENGN